MSSESRRSTSIARHLLLAADLLQGREHDRRSLAARLAIKPAMADRLINAALEHLPSVVENRDGKQRKIRMDLGALAGEPSYPTAIAACLGGSLWPLFEGSSYQNGIRDALGHIVGRTKRRSVFKDIDRKFWFLRRGGEIALLDRAPLLDDVLEAILHHRVISMEYSRFNGDLERLRIEPLSLAVHDHQLYIVGRDGTGRFHPYRFARLHSVDVLDETFRYPSRAEYDPEQVFRDSFGVFLNLPAQDVELRLHSRWSVYAQTHRWHDSQIVEVAKDHVRLRLHVRICLELEAWILGFGEQAEVIAPVELRDKIASRASQLARVYAPNRDARLAKTTPPRGDAAPDSARATGR